MARIDRYPESDEYTYYINMGEYNFGASSFSVADIILAAKVYFGEDIDLEKLQISSKRIHTRCITYDQYDSADWDNYIILEKVD